MSTTRYRAPFQLSYNPFTFSRNLNEARSAIHRQIQIDHGTIFKINVASVKITYDRIGKGMGCVIADVLAREGDQ